MKNFCLSLFFGIALSMNQVMGAEQGMPQLDPKYWYAQVFWLILIFSGLYLIIWKVFLPKITDSIENRRLKIVNDLNEAQKLKENAEKKLKEYDKAIGEARKEAKKIIEENRKKLEKDIEIKKEKFNEEIEKELEKVEKEIKDLKKNSISSINKIALEISSEITKKIIGVNVNNSNVSAIVEDISKKRIEKTL